MTASYNMSFRLRQATTILTKGFFQITHNSFALIGLAVLFVVMALVARPELRELGESKLYSVLQERQQESVGMVSDPVANDRATATDPKALPKQQAAVAYWLSKKYRVAPEPIGALVAEAYSVGAQVKIEPTLILAVMAIESRFNPFAQSHVGAQGLMQVMTKIHSDKYEDFGGQYAAFDPLANLRVGVKVLKDCIRMAGSVEGGLKYYVGAGNLESDGGYAAKVMAEYARLQHVADGRPIRTLIPQVIPDATITKVLDTSTAPEAAPATSATPDNSATLAMS